MVVIVEACCVLTKVEIIVVGAVRVSVAVFVEASWVEIKVVVGAVKVRVAVFVDANCVDTSVEMIVVGAVRV